MIVFGDLNYRMTGEPRDILEKVATSMSMHKSRSSDSINKDKEKLREFQRSKYWVLFHAMNNLVGLSSSPPPKSKKECATNAVGTSSGIADWCPIHAYTHNDVEEGGEGAMWQFSYDSLSNMKNFKAQVEESKASWDWVKDYDQLYQQMAEGLIFSGFSEADLCFCPTFRRVVGTKYEMIDSYEEAQRVYTTALGKSASDVRTPSYW